MELWIILSFIGALALIAFLFFDARRRFDKRVRSLLRMQETLRESDTLTDPAKQQRALLFLSAAYQHWVVRQFIPT